MNALEHEITKTMNRMDAADISEADMEANTLPKVGDSYRGMKVIWAGKVPARNGGFPVKAKLVGLPQIVCQSGELCTHGFIFFPDGKVWHLKPC